MPLSRSEIARLRTLREKKHREATGLFVVEGEKVVGELLAAKSPPAELYATAGWISRNKIPASLRAKGTGGTKLIEVTPSEMERISHYPTPSEVLALMRLERRPLVPGELNRGLTLALDGIQDPGNVGALLRVADWFAFDRVLLSPDSADLFSQKVINASMGSFARVTVLTASLAEALSNLRVPVLGCDLEGVDVHELKPMADGVIVIGSEGRGLSPAVAQCITRRLTIPRHGGAESLNAAVAAGIVCDHLRPRVTKRGG